MFELIAIGGIFFWIVTALAVCGVFAAIANESGGWAAFAFVVYLAVIAIFSPFDFTGFVFANPLWLLGLVGTYILASIPAALLLWRNFIGKEAAELEEYKQDWLADKGHKGTRKVPEELREAWTRTLAEKFLGWRYDRSNPIDTEQLASAMRPYARDNKGMIIFWISYWPICLLWELVGDWIVNISKTIYRMLGKWFDSMSERRYSGLTTELHDGKLNAEQVKEKLSGLGTKE